VENNLGKWHWLVKENLLIFDEFVTNLFGFSSCQPIKSREFLDKLKIISADRICRKVMTAIANKSVISEVFEVEIGDKVFEFDIFGNVVLDENNVVIGLRGEVELTKTSTTVLPAQPSLLTANIG
jgi:hypothetical protein